MSSTRLDLSSYKHLWPNSNFSRQELVGKLSWHFQKNTHRSSEVPKILLLHGAGSATHTWRDILLPMSEWAEFVAVDLPGHAFTGLCVDQRSIDEEPLSINAMGHELHELLSHLEFKPNVIVGHSAGGAIAAQMVFSGLLNPKLIVGLNPAWTAYSGASGFILTSIAKAVSATPLVPFIFASIFDKTHLGDLLVHNTASKIDQNGLDLYKILTSNAVHIRGVTQMMASWDLSELSSRLSKINCEVKVIL